MLSLRQDKCRSLDKKEILLLTLDILQSLILELTLVWDTVITRDSKVGRLLYYNTKPIGCCYKANWFTKKLIKSIIKWNGPVYTAQLLCPMLIWLFNVIAWVKKSSFYYSILYIRDKSLILELELRNRCRIYRRSILDTRTRAEE